MKKYRVLCKTCGVIETELYFIDANEEVHSVPIFAMSKKAFKKYLVKEQGFEDEKDFPLEIAVKTLKLTHEDIYFDKEYDHSIGKYACWTNVM